MIICLTSWLTMRVLISSMVELTDSSHVKLDVMPPPPSPPPHIISNVDPDPGSTVCDDEPDPVYKWSRNQGGRRMQYVAILDGQICCRTIHSLPRNGASTDGNDSHLQSFDFRLTIEQRVFNKTRTISRTPPSLGPECIISAIPCYAAARIESICGT